MLGKARQILVSELTFALKMDEETAEAKLDEVLGKGDPVPTTDGGAAPAKAAAKAPAKAVVKKAPAKKAAKAPAKAK
jgi:hypothetical protein